MKLGFVAGCFDVGPHLGHLLMLAECERNCDKLVIALHVDPSTERPDSKRKPAPTLSERFMTIKAIMKEAEVIPYESESELREMLLILNPSIRFLGSDYMNKKYTGDDLFIPVHFCVRSHSLSSSRLRKMVSP